jgi:cysteine desulfurase
MTEMPSPSRPTIYLDYSATTPLAPEVREAMRPYLEERWGNASSTHKMGSDAREGVEVARRKVAKLLGCEPEEIVFTSGGTESDSLAILGAAFAARAAGRGNHVVSAVTEHKAVLEAVRFLERDGFETTLLGVNSLGVVELADFTAALRPETVLVSIMLGNNETGVFQPNIQELAALCRAKGVLFHCDAVQAVGRIPVSIKLLGVDLLSISGHKIHAPKGVGALYVRQGVTLSPPQAGGGQEDGRRGGTENVAGIVGLGVAADLARSGFSQRANQEKAQRNRLWQSLSERLPGLSINGGKASRMPHILSVAIPGANAQKLVATLSSETGVCCAAGSACSSDGEGQPKASHVLMAMGLGEEVARGSLRFSLGRYTTEREIDEAIELVAPVIARETGLPLTIPKKKKTPPPPPKKPGQPPIPAKKPGQPPIPAKKPGAPPVATKKPVLPGKKVAPSPSVFLQAGPPAPKKK